MGKKSGSKKKEKVREDKKTTGEEPSPGGPPPSKKKKNKKDNKKKGASEDEKRKRREDRVVTMQALEELSSSSADGEEGEDGKLPPEEEWDGQALALKKAIDSGAFDRLLQQQSAGAKGTGDDDDDDSIEEVVLGSDDDDEEEEEEEETGNKSKASRGQKQEDEVEGEESGSDEDDEKEEEEVEGAGGAAAADDDDAGSNSDDDGQHSKEAAEEEEEEEGDDDDDDDDDLTKKNALSSKAMHVVTEDLRAEKRGWPWAETFDILSSEPLPFRGQLHHRRAAAKMASADGGGGDDDDEQQQEQEQDLVDIHDDLKREVIFYDTALAAVSEARSKCEEAGIPFSRPDDFFAEMVKTDDHMAKVKDRLIFETKKIDAVAQRKSNKEQKLRAKEAHSNKLAEKAKRKREHFKALDDWAQSAKSKRGRLLDDYEDSDALNSMGRRGQQGGGPNKKRLSADRKFGFGGKRGRFKQNDRKTLNDMSDYNPRGNFAGGMKKQSNRNSAAGSGKRKGKRARDAMRAGKR